MPYFCKGGSQNVKTVATVGYRVVRPGLRFSQPHAADARHSIEDARGSNPVRFRLE